MAKHKFEKGNPGGPGRPKGSLSLVSMLKERLEKIPEGKKKTYAELFIDKVLKKSIDDEDVQAMRDVLNRVDGLPKQPLDVGGEVKFIVELHDRD